MRLHDRAHAPDAPAPGAPAAFAHRREGSHLRKPASRGAGSHDAGVRHFRPLAEALDQRVLLAASMVKDINSSPAGLGLAALVRFGDVLLFRAHEPARGQELYRTDGTPQGTALLKDINPGAMPSFI